jgi:hypothetical protein
MTVCPLGASVSVGLYDDVHELGGLSDAVQDALTRVGSSLTARDLDIPKEKRGRFPAYARVGAAKRFSQIYMAQNERLFLFDFWDQGVWISQGETPSLEEMAKALHAWIADDLSIALMEERFAFFRAGPMARAFEKGTEVEETWLRLLAKEPNPPERPLQEILELASKEAALRKLFPFTSLITLCFSRCTGYPYTRDCPAVTPLGEGRYKVTTMDLKLLGEGTAREALQILLRNLPANCGPAVKGTAKELGAE